jgi:hypothetical protein
VFNQESDRNCGKNADGLERSVGDSFPVLLLGSVWTLHENLNYCAWIIFSWSIEV